MIIRREEDEAIPRPSTTPAPVFPLTQPQVIIITIIIITIIIIIIIITVIAIVIVRIFLITKITSAVPPWWRDNSTDDDLGSPLASARNSSLSSASLPSSLSSTSLPDAASGHCPVDCSSSFRTLIGVLMVRTEILLPSHFESLLRLARQ